MQTFQADLAIVGAGGAGLRAAIAAAQANPNAKIALISKVYPMRSHTVAAEGGSAAVAQDHDSFEYHFHDTVAGGDWLCEQDVVDYFVHHCPTEMTASLLRAHGYKAKLHEIGRASCRERVYVLV